MDSEQILKLLDAGYTKADIDKMEAKPDGQDSGSSDDTAGAETKTTPENKEEKKEISADDALKALTETVNSLTETVKAMQAKNITGATGGKPEKDTIDDVMKSFIESM